MLLVHVLCGYIYKASAKWHCFKMPWLSILVGIPSIFGPHIHKQLSLYWQSIIRHGLHTDWTSQRFESTLTQQYTWCWTEGSDCRFLAKWWRSLHRFTRENFTGHPSNYATYPSVALISYLAPYCKSILAISRSPLVTASCNGVTPALLVTFTLASCSENAEPNQRKDMW